MLFWVRLILWISFLSEVLLTVTEAKRKYPFYRPIYTDTPILFQKWIAWSNKIKINNFQTGRGNSNDNQNYNDSNDDSNNNNNNDNDNFSPSSDITVALSQINNVYKQWDSYHNFEQIMLEIEALKILSDMEPYQNVLRVYKPEAVSMQDRPIFRIQFTNFKSNPFHYKRKILMIFGEHPREFITTESCFDMLHWYLYDFINGNLNMSMIINEFDIHIIPILNPDGKVILEKNAQKANNFCWRWNGNRVDLNRNFDWEFSGSGSTHKKGTEEWHGERPFCEREAAYIRDLVEQYHYDIVIDVHSGSQQIFIPFVDTTSRKAHRTRPQTDEENRLVQYIQTNSNGWYTNSGVSWKYNDYGADGTIMDWVGGKANVSYSLCAEIYGDPNVDSSIDCFVQFNPDNGQHFQKSLASIRALYDHTFSYFLHQRRTHASSEELAHILSKTSLQLQNLFVKR